MVHMLMQRNSKSEKTSSETYNIGDVYESNAIKRSRVKSLHLNISKIITILNNKHV